MHISLVGLKIQMKNAFTKIFKQIDKLIKQDWQYLRLENFEKKACKTGY